MIKNSILITFITVCLFAACDVTLEYFSKYHWRRYELISPAGLTGKDDRMFFGQADAKLPRGRTYQITAFKGDSEIYFKTIQTIGTNGFRITPNGYRGDGKPAVVFDGCSNLFGFSVSDEETIPYFFSALEKSVNVFNYGITGGAPNTLLIHATSEFPELAKKFPKVTYIYMFYKYHPERLYPSTLNPNWMFPTFRKNDQNELELVNFKIPWPVKDLLLYRSFFLRNISEIFASWNSRARSEENKELALALLSKTNELAKKHNIDFIIAGVDLDDAWIRDFKRLGFRFFQIEEVSDEYKFVKLDGHPTKEGNRILAERIFVGLKRGGFNYK